MKLIKLTALTSLLFAFVFGLSSCEKNAEKKKTTDYQKQGIAMTGAQETPANTSTGLGTMDVFYSKETRILNWSATWSGLTGSPSGMHIHGLAPTGYQAGIVQTISTSGLAATSSKSGTLLVDGFKVKEEDLLNGFYYLNIHTGAFPGGEIRGQIVFQ